MLWHSLLEIAVYLVVLALVLVRLEQSQRATANLKSMQLIASLVVLVQEHALQEQFLRSNFTQNEKQSHSYRSVAVFIMFILDLVTLQIRI